MIRLRGADQAGEEVVFEAVGRKGQDTDIVMLSAKLNCIYQGSPVPVLLEIMLDDLVEYAQIFEQIRGLRPHRQCGDVIVRAGPAEVAQCGEGKDCVSDSAQAKCQDDASERLRA